MTAPAIGVQSIEHLDFQPTCDARDGKTACEAPADFLVRVHGHILAYNNESRVDKEDMDFHLCCAHLAALNEHARNRLPSRCRACPQIFTRLSDVILRVMSL